MLFVPQWLRRSAVSIAVIMAAAVLGHALEPTTPLSRLGHQSWTVENGLPQNTVPVLLQSRSGYLWAGTELGLARFDGVSFRVFDHAIPGFPDAEIRCILDASDGSLWAGTGDGLVHILGGKSTLFTTREGLPHNSVRSVIQTSDRNLWVWTEGGIAHWDGKQFQSIASQSDAPHAGITSIAADNSGILWVGTAGGAFFHDKPGWHRASPLSANATLVALVNSGVAGQAYSGSENPNGDVLLASTDGIYRAQQGRLKQVAKPDSLLQGSISFVAGMADGSIAAASNSTVVILPATAAASHDIRRFAVGKQLPGSRIESLYADREGSWWIGTNHGMARIAPGAQTAELMPQTDPLAAAAVVAFLEDREGDLWAGTETSGLHILRDAHFQIVGAAEGLSSESTTAIVQDANKAMWIGTRDHGLNRIADGKTTVLTDTNGLLSNVILSLAAEPSGDLWVGTPDGLNRISKGKITSFTSADGLPDDFIRSLLAAPDNSLWIGTRHGLTHWQQGRFRTFTQADGLGSDLVGALALAPNGDLWIATLNGLSRLHGDKLHNFTTADGLSSNIVTALDFTPAGSLWIGTQDHGLDLWNGQQILHTSLSGITEIHGLTHDSLNHLWIAGNFGLARTDEGELLACAQNSTQHGCPASAHLFTTADGLRSRETSNNGHPTAIRTQAGLLWFATPRGAMVADPANFAKDPGLPLVDTERFVVDDKEIPLETQTGPLSIAAGHLRFEFDYAGLSFASPQKIRYQYALEGFDRDWTDAGTRRTAYYTNIPPGHYRFRVRVSYADVPFSPEEISHVRGIANTTVHGPSEAFFSFELRPHFYETAWFYVLLVVALAWLVYLAIRLLAGRRVRRAEREFSAVSAERSRIAREIHDTLAQGYVGISLQLEILGELLRHNRADAASKHLALTQNFVREGLADARQSIWALRSQDAEEQTLPTRLRRLVEQAEETNLSATLIIHGAYRPLPVESEQEILRIAQEAIHNGKKHASATALSVRLDYNPRELELTVTDNGKGFDVASHKAKEGHYGLTGIHERSALIQGRIEILSKPGAGTTVRLNVPLPGASASAEEKEV
jgi:signal transduction histidine kinase/ligand-binding sensor domain-containing protein